MALTRKAAFINIINNIQEMKKNKPFNIDSDLGLIAMNMNAEGMKTKRKE